MRGLPPIPTIGQQQQPYAPRKPRRVQQEPRYLDFPQQRTHTGGPGDPPPNWDEAKTSDTEWYPYWGLARIFGEPSPEHVREAPFVGAPGIWEYQKYIPGGIVTTNIDFLILPTNGLAKPTAIRVQTEFVHLFPQDNDKYAADIIYRNEVELAGYNVVDIYDYQFLGDPSGQAVIVQLKAAMGLIEQPNPILTGTARRVPD